MTTNKKQPEMTSGGTVTIKQFIDENGDLTASVMTENADYVYENLFTPLQFFEVEAAVTKIAQEIRSALAHPDAPAHWLSGDTPTP